MTRLIASVTTTLKTWCARVTRSRMTIAFLLFVLANFVAQLTLYAIVLSSNKRDKAIVTNAIDTAGVHRGFTVIQQGILKICHGIPTMHDVQCAEGLTWLENFLRDTMNEEIVCVVLQGWVTVMSLVALIDESVPHLVAVLAAQVVNTTWISYRTVDDVSKKHVYDKIIVDETCGAFNIIRGSWEPSASYVILGFSTVTLLSTSLFVLKLAKLYSKQTLASVGSARGINRMLKWLLWAQVFLQFTVFFTIVSTAVWYAKWKNDIIAHSTNLLSDACFYVAIIVLLLWYSIGMYSISREDRPLFVVYAFLSITLLVISGLWFGSALFRYEYETWCFFAYMITMTDALLVITCILSFVCRVNFGKGLAHFLVVKRKLQSSGFARDIFLLDASNPGKGRKCGTNTKKLSGSRRPELVSHLTIDPSRSNSSLKPSEHCPSVGSVRSAVFQTWLAPQDSEGMEKCQLWTRKTNELDIVVISREVVSARDDHLEIPDDDSESKYASDEEQDCRQSVRL